MDVSKIKNARLWKKIRDRITDLYINKQVTKKLLRLVLEADYTDQVYITFLSSLCEDCIRLKGYYNNSARIEACDKVIDIAIAEYHKEVAK